MQFRSIQYLRAVAALLVVLFHVHNQIERMGYDAGWPGGLASGVDVFFVISGFVMWITTHDRQGTPFDFYYRRVVRIVPLYWLLTAFVVMLLLFAPHVFQTTRLDAVHIVKSFLFIPALNEATGMIEPVLVPGWTLNYEMFFYVIFGFMLLLPQRLRVASTCAVLIGLVVLGRVDHQPGTVLSFYEANIILEFGMGVFLGSMMTSGARVSSAIAWALMIFGALALAATSAIGPSEFRGLLWGIPAACLVAGAVLLEQNRRMPEIRLLHLLGDASYSIYLSHGIAMSALGQVWRSFDPQAGDSVANVVLFSIVSVVVASAGGVLVYQFVEKPFIAYFRPRKATAAARQA